MFSFAVIALFIVSGMVALAVLADGFIQGKARYAELMRDLDAANAPRIVTVQVTGDLPAKPYRRPASVAKIIASPIQMGAVTQPLGAAA